MTDPQVTWKKLCDYERETALLSSVKELTEWDERTMLPAAAGAFRAQQVTHLAGLVHARQTDPRRGEWIDELASSPLASDPHSDSGTTIRQLKREYERQTRRPQRLVEELSRATVLGQQAWSEARKANDFPSFQPHLTTIVGLKQEEADVLGFEQQRYDALLDEYEPNARTADVELVLRELREALVPLISAIGQSSRQAPLQILRKHFPAKQQAAFGTAAAEGIGFDFSRGRLDVTDHPFCTTTGPDDCRITTRYDEQFFPSAFFSILHEAGHGIYEQGLRHDQYGLPPGQYVSLGIHESQSRLWENSVGRSRAFWEFWFPQAQEVFAEALRDVQLEPFVFAVNHVQPSLIRVEADEATYNLHVIVRFELEQALLSGDLAIVDLPSAWQEKYHKYLGIEPETDRDGVLQDIHWSAGLIGYFPTYSLGNLYAAQFFQKAQGELGDLDELFRAGDYRPLREWLKKNIHAHGQCYSAAELVQQVTGEPLSHRYLMDYLHGKLDPLYQL